MSALTNKSCWYDICKLFIPFGWGIFCVAGVIGYSARSRWIAASAWLMSMIISIAFMFHIWMYHRSNKPTNYRQLPEINQRNVSIKLIIAIIVCITTLIVSIIFWASKKPEEYADASAYTMSFLISSVWLFQLWKYHRGKAIIDQDIDEINQQDINNKTEQEAMAMDTKLDVDNDNNE